jgi:casein kinase I family protein HRR25
LDSGDIFGTNLSFLIMEKLGYNLRDLLRRVSRHRFSLKTVVQIGLQLVNNLKVLHNKGFVHCDIKTENIVIGSCDFRSSESSIIYLIDFGVSHRFIDLNGDHLPKKVALFRGNLLFASA